MSKKYDDTYRTKTELLKSVGEERYKELCIKLITEYATTDPRHAESDLCEKYKIKPSCYRAMKDDGIANNWVSDDIVDKVMNKAIANQKLHAPKAGKTSVNKTLRMYKVRSEKKQAKSEEEKVKNFAEIFAENDGVSKADLAEAAGYTVKEADQLILKAIIENFVSDDIVKLIEKRSIKNATYKRRQVTKEYFEGLWKIRRANQKGVTL